MRDTLTLRESFERVKEVGSASFANVFLRKMLETHLTPAEVVSLARSADTTVIDEAMDKAVDHIIAKILRERLRIVE